MKRTFLRNAGKCWVLADQTVVSAGGFITCLLLARGLGMQVFGYYSSIGMVQLFLLSVMLAVSSQVFQVVYPSEGEKQKKKLLAGFFWQQVFLCVALMVAGLVVVVNFYPDWLHRLTALFATVAIAGYLLQDFLRRILLTQGRGREAFSIGVLNNFLQVALLFFFWQTKLLNHTSAWAIIAATFLPSLLLAVTFIRPGKCSRAAISYAWRYQRKKGGWLLCSSLLQWGSGYFFVLAAGWWLGAAALGVLRLAQYIFGLLNLLLQAVENYALPKAAAGVQDPSFFIRLTQKSVMLMLPPLALLVLFRKQILMVAGGDGYVSNHLVMLGMAAIYLVMTIGYPVRIAIRSLHLDQAYFTAYCFSVAIGVCSAPLLVQRYGLYGVLAGMMLTQLVCTGYWLYFLHHKKIFSWKSFISF